MKKIQKYLFYLGIFGIITFGCERNDPKTISTPIISTAEICKISAVTATCGGTIYSDLGIGVIARGVCWSTEPEPTIADSITIDNTGIGSYTSLITGLMHSTTYYVRAYVTYSTGTGYGMSVPFTTQTPSEAILGKWETFQTGYWPIYLDSIAEPSGYIEYLPDNISRFFNYKKAEYVNYRKYWIDSLLHYDNNWIYLYKFLDNDNLLLEVINPTVEFNTSSILRRIEQ